MHMRQPPAGASSAYHICLVPTVETDCINGKMPKAYIAKTTGSFPIHKKVGMALVNVNQHRCYAWTQDLDVEKTCDMVQAVEGISGVNKQNCFCVIKLKNGTHGMYSCFASSTDSCTKLEQIKPTADWTSGLMTLRIDLLTIRQNSFTNLHGAHSRIFALGISLQAINASKPEWVNIHGAYLPS